MIISFPHEPNKSCYICDILTQKFTVIWFLHLQNIESGDGFHVDFSK